MTISLTNDQKDQVLDFCMDIADENRQVKLFLDDLQDLVPVDEYYLFRALDEFSALGLIDGKIQIRGLSARTSPISFTLSAKAWRFMREGGFATPATSESLPMYQEATPSERVSMGAFVAGVLAMLG
ncbi:hypothetical protein [Telluribacter sp. SYSU D00476]|uniref:hypothetical protein n=1 Tax=Telluribacter sp. SYSU D00476 TaxID=2811430 RepID=UPI001FF1354F|nr:hypothetical protein [Telluribacter sp. SYSU D00476]